MAGEKRAPAGIVTKEDLGRTWAALCKALAREAERRVEGFARSGWRRWALGLGGLVLAFWLGWQSAQRWRVSRREEEGNITPNEEPSRIADRGAAEARLAGREALRQALTDVAAEAGAKLLWRLVEKTERARLA